jgi:hypothetical protein
VGGGALPAEHRHQPQAVQWHCSQVLEAHAGSEEGGVHSIVMDGSKWAEPGGVVRYNSNLFSLILAGEKVVEL